MYNVEFTCDSRGHKLKLTTCGKPFHYYRGNAQAHMYPHVSATMLANTRYPYLTAAKFTAKMLLPAALAPCIPALALLTAATLTSTRLGRTTGAADGAAHRDRAALARDRV